MHRTRDRRALIAAIGLSSFGDELAIVALALRVESLTGSAGMVALLFIVSALPHVLFAPFSGWLTDRRETVQTLRWCALVQAVVAAALAFAVGMPLVFLLAFALGALASVTGPSVFALVPLLDEEGDTSKTNAKIEIAKYAGWILGPLVAGVVAHQNGTAAPLLIDALTFLVLAIGTLGMSIRRMPVPADEAEQRRGARRIRLRRTRPAPVAGLHRDGRDRPVRGDRQRGRGVLREGHAQPTVDRVRRARVDVDGGHGGRRADRAPDHLGTRADLDLRRRRRRVAPPSSRARHRPPWSPAAALFVISGAGNGVENVAARTLVHGRVPAALHGRVFAAYMGLVSSTQIIATALGGALVVGVGGQQALVIGGLGSLAVGLLGLIGLAFMSAAKPAVAESERDDAPIVVDRSPASGDTWHVRR